MSKITFYDNALQFSQHDYLLIDRALVGSVDGLENQLPLVELVMPTLEPQAKLYPYLLPIKEASFNKFQQICNGVRASVKNNDIPIFSILYKSKLPTELFKGCLAELMIVRDRHSVVKNYAFRFYDPKVFFHLLWIFSPEELNGIFSSAEVYNITFLLGRKWYTLELDYISGKRYSHVELNDNIEKLSKIGLINRAFYNQKVFLNFDINESISLGKCIYDFISFIEERYHIHDAESLIMLSEKYIEIDSLFYRHPYIDSILNDCFNGKGNYCQLIREISPSKWDDIRNYDYQLIKEDDYGM